VRERLGKIHDVREELGRDSGAIASLTVLSAGRRVSSHVHANPYLALHVLGSYRDHDDRGAVSVNGPAALFFPAGSTHEMTIGNAGLVTVIVEFDSDALQRAVGDTARLKHSRSWVGGNVGRCARRLARGWLSSMPTQHQFGLTTAFLNAALGRTAQRRRPRWLDELEAFVDTELHAPDIESWARRIGVTRSWLVRAYRQWCGEGLGSSDLELAEVAVEVGFCDQSHMNRAFKWHLGRTPAVARTAQWGLSRERSRGNASRSLDHDQSVT